MGTAKPLRPAQNRNHERHFRVLDATELELEDEPAIEEALYLWKDSAADFADCLIGAHHPRLGCRATASFDVKALQLPGFVAG
jgi:predicted nucleic-acid-binding protein